MKFKQFKLEDLVLNEFTYSPADENREYLFLETKNEFFIFDKYGVGQMYKKYEEAEFIFLSDDSPNKNRILKKNFSLKTIREKISEETSAEDFFKFKKNEKWDKLISNIRESIIN